MSTLTLPRRLVHCLILALGLGTGAALASDSSHRQEDQAKHQRIAQAHAAMATCLGGNREASACLAELQAACKGLAIGPHCGLKRGPEDFKDRGARRAEHQRMHAIHDAAAQCLASPRAYRECSQELGQACGGVGVGRYCGMRHAH